MPELLPIHFITLKEAIRMLHEHRTNENTIFSVLFEKRTGNCDVRHMVCRFNVKEYLVGGKRAYDPHDYNLMCVFDVEKANYRNINLETLMWVRMAQRVEGRIFYKACYIITCNVDLQQKWFPDGLQDYHRTV